MDGKFNDIVVLLPGISGSELVTNNRVVWGWNGGALLRNLLSEGQTLRGDLSIGTDSPTDESIDGVRASRLLPDLHILPGLWKVDGYSAIQSFLQQRFALRLRENFFPFPYDWRRDNRAAANKLYRDSRGWLKDWRARSGNTNAKLVLVAHSMGGLVSRYFLEVLEGWRDTRALITFGTPYAGSINAVDSLANGMTQFGVDLTGALRTMYSAHQLLPTYSCCVTEDGSLKHLSDVAIKGLEASRYASAIRFHAEIRDAAKRNKEDEEYRVSTYATFPIVGLNQPTHNSVRVNASGIELLESLGNEEPGGDGTVPRQSAVPAGFPLASAMFASTRHASLQDDPATLAHLGGVISSLYLPDELRGGYVSTRTSVSLAINDVYWSDQSVEVRAKPSDAEARLQLTVSDVETRAVIRQAPLAFGIDEWQRTDFTPPYPGVFEIVVGGDKANVERVRDVIEVVPQELRRPFVGGI